MTAIPPELQEASFLMSENLHEHVSFVQRRTSAMRVEDTPELLVVDSGLSSDTFNKILRVRTSESELAPLLAAAVCSFEDRPFTLWTGPSDRPEDLALLLPAMGWTLQESEVGMVMPARALGPAEGPPGLQIRRARTAGEVSDFASVNAANWDPPDSCVTSFFAGALPLLLDPSCPMRLYVAYLEGTPVAAAELFLSSGGRAAGLHMISTRAAYQRRGIGLAVTAHVCREGCDAGAEWLVLQASPAGEGVYRRMGFQPAGRFNEYRFGG